MNAVTLSRSVEPWRNYLPGLLLAVAVLLLFQTTVRAIVSVWYFNGTYAHAFLVPPISAWLAWRQRDQLVGVPVRPEPWMLLPLTAMCLLWLVGELAAAAAPTQFALVAMLVICVPLALGLPVSRVLLFPLLFLFFAVPMGEALVPKMMEWTADFTVAAVSFSGVPVYRQGQEFIVPTGSWSVVEACSGVRYLIASVMVGTLFAYLNYNSYRRRLLFILVSLLVPLLANWLRAYMIVMLGHLSGNKLAVGVDHIIYGWVFFGVVIGIMFFIGARWAEPSLETSAPAAGAVAADTSSLGRGGWLVLALALVALGATQIAFSKLDVDQSGVPVRLELPAAWGGGWMAEDASIAPFTPAFKGAKAEATRTYRLGDERVAAWVGYYHDQNYETKLVTTTNVLAEATGESRWAQANQGGRTVATPAGAINVLVANVQASLAAPDLGGRRLRAWQVYWVGGHYIASGTRARLQLAVNRLLGRGDDAAVVIFYTEGADPELADARLERFAAAGVPALSAQLGNIQARR